MIKSMLEKFENIHETCENLEEEKIHGIRRTTKIAAQRTHTR
jgi:hypothetical protein